MSSFSAVGKPLDWPKDSQKYDIYINEEGMHEIVFSSQQPKAKDFIRHCCNVLLSHVRQQLSDKPHAMEIEDLTSCVQAFEFTNKEKHHAHHQQILRLNEDHQQTIEEKDSALALFNDYLQNCKYENVAL